MGIAYHTLYSPDGAGLNLFDRATFGTVTAVYGAGTSGGSVTQAVTWGEPVATPYMVLMSPVEPSTYYITSRTPLGFSLVVAPALTTGTLAGGSVEILIVS